MMSSPASISSASHSSSSPPTTPEEYDGIVKLPEPFFPASLIKRKEDDGQPRSIPARYRKRLPLVPLERQVDQVAPDDNGTPDAWVKRDPRLVRLTGKHPFNCEARLNTLYDAGFLTPTNLFYVRNHGAVPQVSEADASAWTLDVCGLVQRPQTFTLLELMQRFETVTLPITLVCAGNRRKEQNVYQKSLGFSWGAGGLSTALFTGVYLADVLEACCPTRGAKHCIFEGNDSLPKGPYGTSQKLSWAKDRSKGMLLSWAMNGLPLEPDHGYPLRVVIPGQIGGRSVKWLSKIEISAQESQHYLHFYDNKVLPTELTADAARESKDVWYDPRYIITELNVNSAIAYPDHHEVFDHSKCVDGDVYTAKGYAYAGGGRRINRVEISLDEGETWKLADIEYPEDQYRQIDVAVDEIYGRFDLSDKDTCFCWCFWTYQIPIATLKSAACIQVRASDEALGIQPQSMYWNPTGMMNNWYFRVAIHQESENSLKFEHPTLAGTAAGGWMQRMKDAGLNELKPVFSKQIANADKPVARVKKAEVVMTKSDVTRKITMTELEAHNKAEEPWFVVRGEVYDGTGFLSGHPGGPESIQLVAGEDATEEFMAIHSADAKKQLIPFHIGTLVGSSQQASTSKIEQSVVKDTTGPFLHQKNWKSVKLIEIQKVSHDSRLLRFALHGEQQSLGLPTGQHCFMRLRAKAKEKWVVEGELIQRAYTPVSFNSVGYVDFLIKVYFSTADHPEGGKMSQALEDLVLGDSVELKGPVGSFVHLGKGLVKWRGKERSVKKIGCICGGTGITPIMQVLRGVLSDSEDTTTELSVLNCNRNFEDILMRTDLEELQARHSSSNRLRMFHTLTRPHSDWQHSKGRITLDMLRETMPAPDQDTIICLCGPEPMQELVKELLQKLGYDIAADLVIF